MCCCFDWQVGNTDGCSQLSPPRLCYSESLNQISSSCLRCQCLLEDESNQLINNMVCCVVDCINGPSKKLYSNSGGCLCNAHITVYGCSLAMLPDKVGLHMQVNMVTSEKRCLKTHQKPMEDVHILCGVCGNPLTFPLVMFMAHLRM